MKKLKKCCKNIPPNLEAYFVVILQGQAGVEEVLSIIKEEFRIAMALSGKYLYFNQNRMSVYIVTSSLKITITYEKKGSFVLAKYVVE